MLGEGSSCWEGGVGEGAHTRRGELMLGGGRGGGGGEESSCWEGKPRGELEGITHAEGGTGGGYLRSNCPVLFSKGNAECSQRKYSLEVLYTVDGEVGGANHVPNWERPHSSNSLGPFLFLG